ncbi:unnamed protein product [Brachionus calyciflorus]|uniref:Tetraspanin n=1 Tax=Brachionus calyciflorus TaxID=104777 RepID=A0A814SI30_9BILA|nr:unnamed protein product [Brachionus calyciflorus]
MARTGFFGSIIRIILAIVNILFLLIGFAVFIAAAILRWSKDSILNKIATNDVLKPILNVTAINDVSLILLILGAFITVLSIIGLCGACCANRFFLGVYEIVIVVLFISHGIVLVVAAFKSGTIENEFRKALNQTVFDVNSDKTDEEYKMERCSALKLISEIFECCGLNGPNDFTNATYVTECCYGSSTDGCGDKTVKSFKENGVNIIIIPNSIVLGLEFLIIVLVPFLIGRITRSRRMYEDVDENERIISIKPTNYQQNYRY